MVMMMKNAVTAKNSPNFWSFWAVTKNLGFMNWLTIKKQAKANKIARESKWKSAESCVLIWADSEAISRATDKQKPIIKSAQSMYRMWWWWCTTTKPAASAGRTSTTSSGSTRTPEVEGSGSCGLNFWEELDQFYVNWTKEFLENILIFGAVESFLRLGSCFILDLRGLEWTFREGAK